MRGEHRILELADIQHAGSSPHARGTRHPYKMCVPGSRIIPACAGNTRPHIMSQIIAVDHPRMRGEHQYDRIRCRECRGSSPHARGTHHRHRLARHSTGIIPACAGNTCSVAIGSVSRRDHPRMRGEHGVWVAQYASNGGSSPHARGTLCKASTWGGYRGIIPACAGNTIHRLGSFLASGDHPRMRGEHSTIEALLHDAGGSSPHARGTLTVRRWRRCRRGIIPACAGNTLMAW